MKPLPAIPGSDQNFWQWVERHLANFEIVSEVPTVNTLKKGDVVIYESGITRRLYFNIAGIIYFITIGSGILTIVEKIAAYTATSLDDVIICGVGNQTFTVKLPALFLGKFFHVKNVGTGVITLDANSVGNTTIDGDNTKPLVQYESLKVIAGSSEYHIL